MKNNRESTPAPSAYGWVYRGFGSDLFGRLLPGLLFIIGSIVSIFPPIYVFMRTDSTKSCIDALLCRANDIAPILDSIWVLLVIVILFLSYAIGHLFFRSEIKKVDIISYERCLKRGLDERITDLACDSTLGCEYPYPYLGEYLKKRGFDHLLPLVPWTEKNKSELRSKKYMDLLKIRIMAKDGELANILVHNEAHIRLSSGLWFAADAMKWVASIGLGIVILATLLDGMPETTVLDKFKQPSHIGPLFAPGAILLIAIYIQRMVTSFLHELRVREVLFILETAHIMFKSEPKLLQDIAPDFGKER